MLNDDIISIQQRIIQNVEGKFEILPSDDISYIIIAKDYVKIEERT